ncbi:hypothetical protein D3C76_1040600 [compost metagenome]
MPVLHLIDRQGQLSRRCGFGDDGHYPFIQRRPCRRHTGKHRYQNDRQARVFTLNHTQHFQAIGLFPSRHGEVSDQQVAGRA